jgi:hypothetical protein
MPIDDTVPGLDALLLGTALELELSDRDHRVAEKRYQLLPEYLQRPTSPLHPYMEDALVYAQGSRAIGATIIDGATDDRFDLDAILEFRRPSGWSISDVLDELFIAFQGFPDVQGIERCTRCIQLKFAFMHLDVTPMDPHREPRPLRSGVIYHSPEDGGDQLFAANPYGFSDWFQKKVALPSRAFSNHVKTMRANMGIRDRLIASPIMADADIDALPARRNPLRDAPQVIALKLMKRYLNLRYAKRSLKRPISIYLSKIAALVPPNEKGLCAQLESYALDLERRVHASMVTGIPLDEKNPARPHEGFNDRWPAYNEDLPVFHDDLRHLVAELTRARSSNFTNVRKIFDELFGERVSEKAVRSYLDSNRGLSIPSAFEPAKGFVAAPALLTPAAAMAAPTSKAPAHHFHSGRLPK